MGRLAFYIVDVFAEKKFSGNQLAVFRDAGSLSSAQMQQIAREMNFSETTFILSEAERSGGYDVSIFTPGAEVPFAGHPTLGTAYIIREEMLRTPVERIVLNLQVGPIPVTFDDSGNGQTVCWMEQIEPRFGQCFTATAIAGILGISPAEIDNRVPVEEVSTGLPHIIVPLRTLESLKRARIARETYFSFVSASWAKPILIFCPEPHERGNDLAVRMFADYYGIAEDPATGSGNGCLAAYLVKHRYWGQDHINVRSEQGYEIGRPSLLFLRAWRQEGRIAVSVGGHVVPVAKGEFL